MLAGLTFILKPLREGIKKRRKKKSEIRGAACQIHSQKLGTGDGTNTDEFSAKFQGGVTFNPKNCIANFGPLYRTLKRAFRKKIVI